MPKRILFIRFSSYGDIVLTTPVVRCVKLQLDAEVHFLTKASYAAALHANPYIDNLITISEDIGEVRDVLRSHQYDWVADLHHNLRSARVRAALRRPGMAFPKLNVEKWLMTNFKIDRLPDRHIVDRYFETVAPLGVVNDGEGLDFFLAEEAHVDIEQATGGGTTSGQFIAMAIGAGLPTKNLEDDQWLELIHLVQSPVILLGGQDDLARGGWLASRAKQCISLAGVLSFPQSASVISQSRVVISPDTGLMHVASALRKPVISIWGNTIPKFGMTPYFPDVSGIRNQHFEIRNLPCRPCSKIGYQQCPRGHFKCIRELPLEEIALAARSLG